MGKTKTPDVAYVVMREHLDSNSEWVLSAPVAIHEYLEDADSMCGKFNQEMKDRVIGTINFSVIAVPFYD